MSKDNVTRKGDPDTVNDRNDPTNSANVELMVAVATSYYRTGMSKVDIAAEQGISRFQVARLLADAMRSGIVEIQIHDPRSYSTDLSTSVSAKLGLRRTVVVALPSDTADLTNRMGKAAMDVLKSLARPQMTIGLAWSRTLDAAAQYFPSLAPCTVVQLVGALQLSGSTNLLQVLTSLDRTPGTRAWPLYTPLLVDEAATAADLRGQPEIAHTLARANDLDLAMVAIGAWKEGESTVWDKVGTDARAAGLDAGAVAEISGRLLDGSGNPVPTGLDDRTIGVSVAQLVATPEVIAVARGASRAEAVLAAVRSGIVTSLVIDSALAKALLGMDT